ncbi:MAG: hypothetical protein ACTSSF_11740, partial [Candidatus Heimdallarchaeaceae archaeon]
SNLNKLYSEGKAVFIIDYPTKEPKIYDVYKNAFEKGYLAYVGPRELDKLRYYSFFFFFRVYEKKVKQTIG